MVRMLSGILGDRAAPTRFTIGYLVLKPLARELRSQVEGAKLSETAIVLDIGCGDGPYHRFFSPKITYVGLDYPPSTSSGMSVVAARTSSDLIPLHGSGEAIPIKNDSIDMVLCTQVLEHAENPSYLIAEINRVLKRGSTVLLSTHGVMPYHPCPNDYWRWTKAGLLRLFDCFDDVKVTDMGSTSGALLFLLEDQISFYCLRKGGSFARALGLGIRWMVNYLGDILDRAFGRKEASRPLIGVYLVAAKK
jgi:hypothetical protein